MTSLGILGHSRRSSGIRLAGWALKKLWVNLIRPQLSVTKQLSGKPMIRYSHVLNLPQQPPFNTEHRWTTFLGRFVKPIVEAHHFPYWFSYYGDHVKFRVHTDNQAVLADIHQKMSDLGLSYRHDKNGNEEEALETLETDLGKPRFLSAQRTDLKPIDRALKILNLLHAGAELFLQSLVEDSRKNWFEEKNTDLNQNPFESASYSYLHLLHNMCQSDVAVYNYLQGQQIGTETHYYYHNGVHEGRIKPVHTVALRLQI